MKKIDFTNLKENAAHMIGQQWMLITAGAPDSFNCMTASWGGLGFLWNRPVAYVFVRPNRYTHRFIEEHPGMTLSFMPEKYRKELVFCGRHSGRDVDKMAETGLKAAPAENGGVLMSDADVVLECRKMFRTRLQQADFLNWGEVSPLFYAEDNPLHDLYICEITACWVKE